MKTPSQKWNAIRALALSVRRSPELNTQAQRAEFESFIARATILADDARATPTNRELAEHRINWEAQPSKRPAKQTGFAATRYYFFVEASAILADRPF